MKTNIFKIVFTALFAHVMCVTVILAHVHAKDAVSLSNQQNAANAKISGGDITAKALGDLHHHIDKMSLKMHTSDTSTQARVRELEPLQGAEFDPSLRDYLEDLLIRLQFGTSLLFRQLAYAAVR